MSNSIRQDNGVVVVLLSFQKTERGSFWSTTFHRAASSGTKGDGSGIFQCCLIVLLLVVLSSVVLLAEPTLAIFSPTGRAGWHQGFSPGRTGWSTRTTTTRKRHKRPRCTSELLHLTEEKDDELFFSVLLMLFSFCESTDTRTQHALVDLATPVSNSLTSLSIPH